jgi:hypothetical protein
MQLFSPAARRWTWIPPVLAVRAAFVLALLLGTLAAVQDISIDCSNHPVYLATDAGLLLTTEDGRLLVTDRGRRECEVRAGTLRLPLPHWVW